jgi:acyl-CoA thioesterase FadM
MIFRIAYWWMRSRFFSSRLDLRDVGRITMKARLTDIDLLKHINNGMYLSLMDIGRVDLLMRAGTWQRLSRLGYYPVVGSATMTYRKSITWRQTFTLETRIVGYDERACYVEQRFVVDGEIAARGIMQERFLKRTGGTVSMQELGEALGVDVTTQPVPEWVRRWADDARLPSGRTPTPSVWEG